MRLGLVDPEPEHARWWVVALPSVEEKRFIL